MVEETNNMAKKTSFKKMVGEAMSEVHRNVPHNVKVTGKTGVAKEKMMQAIGFSKARRKMSKKKKK